MTRTIDQSFSLHDIISGLLPITIVDVGALPLKSQPEPYTCLLEDNRGELIGFEPNKDACAKIKDSLGPPHKCYPFVIGNGNEQRFHINKYPMTNSLFETNGEFVSKFHKLASQMKTQRIETVQTHRLDDVVDKKEIDFLKLDVQGAECAVLEGAQKLASTALVVQTEVSFVPMYINQPLFADVDSHLRNLGFQFHTFMGFGTRDYKPALARALPRARSEQLLWSDAVYIPDVMVLSDYEDNRLLKLATILHDVYASFNLVMHVLSIVESRRGMVGLVDTYRAKLLS